MRAGKSPADRLCAHRLSPAPQTGLSSLWPAHRHRLNDVDGPQMRAHRGGHGSDVHRQCRVPVLRAGGGWAQSGRRASAAVCFCRVHPDRPDPEQRHLPGADLGQGVSCRSWRTASRSPGTPRASRGNCPQGAATRTSPCHAPAAPSGSVPAGPPPPPRARPDPPAASRRRTPCRRRRPRTPARPEAPAPPEGHAPGRQGS